MGIWGYYVRLDGPALQKCREDLYLISDTDKHISLNMESFTVEKTWEALAYLLSKPHRDWMNYEEDEQDQGAVPDLMAFCHQWCWRGSHWDCRWCYVLCTLTENGSKNRY